MKAYILKDRDNSRAAIEARTRVEKTQMEVKGIALDEGVAEKWEASKQFRTAEEVPVMKAKEEVTYVFGEKE